MEQQDKNFYSLLVGISQDVGEFKAEVKNLNSDMKELRTSLSSMKLEFVKADEKISAKLEEYFDYAKKRQDSIKENLEVTIKDHETRIHNLENKSKNKMWAFWEKFKVALVGAVILALVSIIMKFGVELVTLLKTPLKNAIGG